MRTEKDDCLLFGNALLPVSAAVPHTLPHSFPFKPPMQATLGLEESTPDSSTASFPHSARWLRVFPKRGLHWVTGTELSSQEPVRPEPSLRAFSSVTAQAPTSH